MDEGRRDQGGRDVEARRRIPRTDAVLADERLVQAARRLGRQRVKDAVHAAQQDVRNGSLAPGDVIEHALERLPDHATTLRPVLNATGVVVHTNLGRAPLSPAAQAAMIAASGYVDVEYDLTCGARARRGRGALDALVRVVPEAEAALVVNNGAAAVLLAVTALAQGREVIVSRGELVEIGDGFRIPELLESTGARLVEVGTTNRTSVQDYAEAIGPQTALILKVHPSNFRMTGFTAAVAISRLAPLGLPVVADLGSGLLVPQPIVSEEPDAQSALRAGAALVTASGDKLLGGPQAGIVLGQQALVERLRRHPMARALRVDKLTLAALEATVLGPPPPVVVSLGAGQDDLHARAQHLADRLLEAEIDAAVVVSAGVVGGGGAPGQELPGWAVALPPDYAAALRRCTPAVVGRLERNRCLLDLRCVPEAADEAVRRAVLRVTEAFALRAESSPRAEALKESR